MMVGHVAPEAAAGGPIALLAEGDLVTIDLNARRIDLDVAPEILADRRGRWSPPAPHYATGVFAKYSAQVSSASDGAITSAPRR